jgi:hypothetical protein
LPQEIDVNAEAPDLSPYRPWHGAAILLSLTALLIVGVTETYVPRTL